MVANAPDRRKQRGITERSFGVPMAEQRAVRIGIVIVSSGCLRKLGFPVGIHYRRPAIVPANIGLIARTRRTPSRQEVHRVPFSEEGQHSLDRKSPAAVLPRRCQGQKTIPTPTSGRSGQGKFDSELRQRYYVGRAIIRPHVRSATGARAATRRSRRDSKLAGRQPQAQKILMKRAARVRTGRGEEIQRQGFSRSSATPSATRRRRNRSRGRDTGKPARKNYIRARSGGAGDALAR